MSLMTQVKENIDEIGLNFDEFKKKHGSRIDALEKEAKSAREAFEEITKLVKEYAADVEKERDAREEAESRASTPSKAGRSVGIPGLDTPELWRDVKTGQVVRTLSHKDRLSAISPNKTGVSFGRWVRGIVAGKYMEDVKHLGEEAKALATSPNASGGYTVPVELLAEFIDLLRANLVLSKAGARLVLMAGKTLQMAKIVDDATVEWHAENANVNASDMTLGLVELTAKTIVGLVKFSVELSEDSINIESAIARSLSAGVALAIDQAGLGLSIANGPSGILSFQNRQRVTGVGTLTNYDAWVAGMGQLLSANVPLERIGAAVMSPGVWTRLATLKTGITNDNTPLPKPAALAGTPFLVTSSAQERGGSPGGVSYVADWADLLYGIRTDVQFRILREAFLGSNLQIAALIYMRVDFAPAREESFCTIEDIG